MEKIHYHNIKLLIDKEDTNNLKSYISSMQIDINENFSVNPKVQDSMIYYAVKKSKIEIVDFLLSQKNLKIDTPNGEGLTALMHAIIYKKSEIFEKLMSHPEPGLKIGNDKLHPMSRAAQARNLEMLKAISNHPDNDWSLLGNVPFFYAFSNKQTEMGLYIINHPHFNPYVKASHNYPLNMVADNKKAVNAMLALKNFNPNTLIDTYDIDGKKDGQEPLWWKSFNYINDLNYAKVLEKTIINHPCIDVNAKNSQERSLIQTHIRPSQHKAFDMLVENPKVDIHVLSKSNHTVLEEIILNPYQNNDFSKQKDKEKVEKLIARILKEKTHVSDYAQRIYSLKSQSSLRDHALSYFRHILLEDNLPQKTDSDSHKKRKI